MWSSQIAYLRKQLALVDYDDVFDIICNTNVNMHARYWQRKVQNISIVTPQERKLPQKMHKNKYIQISAVTDKLRDQSNVLQT